MKIFHMLIHVTNKILNLHTVRMKEVVLVCMFCLNDLFALKQLCLCHHVMSLFLMLNSLSELFIHVKISVFMSLCNSVVSHVKVSFKSMTCQGLSLGYSDLSG